MAERPVVLGFDFGGTKIAVAACGLDGARLASATVDSRSGDGAEAALARGVDVGRELLAGLGHGHVLAAVGAATFGIPFDDHVELAPSIPGWEAVAFGSTLREAFPGVPIRLSTDVKAAAAAEVRWGSLSGTDPALYLNLGTGLAAAIIVSGQVILGAHGAAGEIGYNIRDYRDLDGAGPAPLEDVISGRALIGSVPGVDGHAVTAAELFELAAARSDAAAVVDAFVGELAMHVANLAVALDPSRIAVGGGMVRSWSLLEPGLRRALDRAVPYPPELVVAAFPHDAPLIGALAIGVAAVGGSDGGHPFHPNSSSIAPSAGAARSPTDRALPPSDRPSEVTP